MTSLTASLLLNHQSSKTNYPIQIYPTVLIAMLNWYKIHTRGIGSILCFDFQSSFFIFFYEKIHLKHALSKMSDLFLCYLSRLFYLYHIEHLNSKLTLSALETDIFTFQVSRKPSLKIHEKLQGVIIVESKTHNFAVLNKMCSEFANWLRVISWIMTCCLYRLNVSVSVSVLVSAPLALKLLGIRSVPKSAVSHSTRCLCNHQFSAREDRCLHILFCHPLSCSGVFICPAVMWLSGSE